LKNVFYPGCCVLSFVYSYIRGKEVVYMCAKQVNREAEMLERQALTTGKGTKRLPQGKKNLRFQTEYSAFLKTVYV
jgi:hypothetical protein